MKRRELIKKLEQAGCHLDRHGGRHDIYINPASGKKQPIPRHTEIHNNLVHHIWKHLGLDDREL